MTARRQVNGSALLRDIIYRGKPTNCSVRPVCDIQPSSLPRGDRRLPQLLLARWDGLREDVALIDKKATRSQKVDNARDSVCYVQIASRPKGLSRGSRKVDYSGSKSRVGDVVGSNVYYVYKTSVSRGTGIQYVCCRPVRGEDDLIGAAASVDQYILA